METLEPPLNPPLGTGTEFFQSLDIAINLHFDVLRGCGIDSPI